jgi:hypothetical protein
MDQTGNFPVAPGKRANTEGIGRKVSSNDPLVRLIPCMRAKPHRTLSPTTSPRAWAGSVDRALLNPLFVGALSRFKYVFHEKHAGVNPVICGLVKPNQASQTRGKPGLRRCVTPGPFLKEKNRCLPAL